MTSFVVRDLFSNLCEDSFRRRTPFSSELDQVHRCLFHPFADDGDREDVLNAWFQRHQPCLFGRVAAATESLHYQFITDRDLLESDQYIADKIHDGLVQWRRRSVSPKESSPAHGFVLMVTSARIAFADPNETMYRLALELLRLWGCRTTVEAHGILHWEDLYLREPRQGSFVRFTFTVDFFAAAGDGRWWQDHRIPGGIGFTANSIGHMRRCREWYDGKSDQREWGLATAMETIARAADTPYGRATWLRDMVDGEPFVRGVPCPFGSMRRNLVGKDWTRYGGHLHTDHAVRREFFRSQPEKSPGLQQEEWLEDFQYLYDSTSMDHARFVEGIAATEEEVLSIVGSPETYTRIRGPRRKRPEAGLSETDAMSYDELEALVASCLRWRLSEAELMELHSYEG